MKKLMAMVMVTLICGTLAAQLQPVTNLQWNQWYSFPHNYFTLSWDAPIPTKEQLTGYNVYRANELYRFQTSQTLFHFSDTSNCDEDFVMYNGGTPFFMHVTAVYNNGQDESGYIDSAYCFGFAIGMDETKSAESVLCPNPTTGLLKIMNSHDVQRAVVMDNTGKILLEATNPDQIELAGLPRGLYFIRLYSAKGEHTQLVIKQ